jgi:hypothetical protein
MNDVASRIAKAIKSKGEVVKTRYHDLMAIYTIRPIKNDQELNIAEKVVGVLTSFNCPPLTGDEQDYLSLLTDVILKYEEPIAKQLEAEIDFIKLKIAVGEKVFCNTTSFLEAASMLRAKDYFIKTGESMTIQYTNKELEEYKDFVPSEWLETQATCLSELSEKELVALDRLGDGRLICKLSEL